MRALVPLIVLAAGLGLSGCSSSHRWCEHDATDTKVADRYCKNHVRGYEWEHGSSHKKHRSSHKKKH
jgi:hypothetical protein